VQTEKILTIFRERAFDLEPITTRKLKLLVQRYRQRLAFQIVSVIEDLIVSIQCRLEFEGRSSSEIWPSDMDDVLHSSLHRN
jgi:hypothetical protein